MTVHDPKFAARPRAPLRFEYLLKVLARPAPGAQDSRLTDDAYFPLVGTEGLPLLSQLGNEAFGDRGPRRYGMTRLEFYRRLCACSNKSFRFVLDSTRIRQPRAIEDDALIGFTCVLPVATNATDRYLRGELSQFELTAEDIQPGSNEIDLWHQAIYLRKRSADWFATSLHALARSMADVIGQAFFETRRPPRLVAEGTSQDGRQFLTSFGMDVAGISKDNCPVYIADGRADRSTGQIDNHRVLSELTRAYAQKSTEGGEHC